MSARYWAEKMIDLHGRQLKSPSPTWSSDLGSTASTVLFPCCSCASPHLVRGNLKTIAWYSTLSPSKCLTGACLTSRNESVVQPSKFSLQDVDYFLNIFTRKFRLKSERKKTQTVNNVNVIYVALVRIFFINKVIHALGLLTLLICFSRFFFGGVQQGVHTNNTVNLVGGVGGTSDWKIVRGEQEKSLRKQTK